METIRILMPNPEEALNFFGSVELIEEVFGLEFSCGDGLFFSDLDESGLSQDKLKFYDGNVDWDSVRTSKGKVYSGKYTLVITYNPDCRTNGKPEFTNPKIYVGHKN